MAADITVVAGITITGIGIEAGEGPDGSIGMLADAGSMIRTAAQSGRRGQLSMPEATFAGRAVDRICIDRRPIGAPSLERDMLAKHGRQT